MATSGRGGSRSIFEVSSDIFVRPAASIIRIAIRSAIALSVSASGLSPIDIGKPISSACILPVGSIRTIAPSSSSTSNLAPASTAVTCSTFPWKQWAIFVVPPPISMLMTRPFLSADRITAPDPWAAIVASRPSPALTATNFPASAENKSPMARALARRTATPVNIRAPVSISDRWRPALRYESSINSPSISASIVSPTA